MDHNEQNIAKFLGALGPQLGNYAGLTCSCVAIKSGTGLEVLQALFLLDFSSLVGSEPKIFESERLLAVQQRLVAHPTALPELIRTIMTSGQLPELVGKRIHLRRAGDGTVSTYFHEPQPGDLPGGRRTLSLALSGERHFELTREHPDLDFELKVNRVPYESLADLFQSFGLAPRIFGDSSRVEIVAPPVVVFQEASTISGESANVVLLASKSITTQQVRIGWRCVKKGKLVDRKAAEGGEIAWVAHGDFLRGSYTFSVPLQSVLLCWLSYEGRFQQQWWLMDPQLLLNPRRSVHECFDPKLEVLEELLFEERARRGQSRKFEEGVAYLLHLLGFRVVHYTSPLDDAPDLVASTANHDVLVIECTRDRLDAGGKLMKLRVRTAQALRALSQSDHPNARVIPVIVTALPRADVADESKGAEEQGIVVVAHEDLRDLLQETRFAPDQHLAVFERARALTVRQNALFSADR